MDPPDKKRAQPSNSDSDATPSKRRQMSSDAAGTAGQQPATASAHPTAVTAAAAAPIAAPAEGSSSMSAGPAVSVSAVTRLSPAERCPSDPLSVALSFLDSRDFAAAIRVCHHWQRTAELQSAWPEFSVERLISGLIQDENYWSQSRSVRVTVDHLSAGALERAAQSAKWRRLTEVCLLFARRPESLNHVAQLPHLQSLHVSGISLDDVAEAFGSMAPRLQALNSESHSVVRVVQSHPHLLANLRVLVLDKIEEIDGRALLPLHQLEYLQLRRVDWFSRDLLLAIRRLSVEHRLRHAALLISLGGTAADVTLLTAELSGSDGDLAAAGLFSLQLSGCFTEQSCDALMCLPALQQLSWSVDLYTADGDSNASQPPLQPLSPLRKLRLDWTGSDVVALARLLQRVAARAPQLQELSLGFGRLPWGPESLQRLRSLLVLEVSLCALPLSLVRMLAALPLFSELIFQEERIYHPDVQLTVDTLRCIAESRSWRLIRLIGHHHRPLLALPGDVDARLAERLADFRVQVEWHSHTICHRLIISADDTVTWPQTEM